MDTLNHSKKSQIKVDLVKKYKRKYAKNRETIEGWLIVAPALIIFFIFVGIPFLAVFYLSFSEWNGFIGNPRLIGFQNYIDIWKQNSYITAYKNTLLIGGMGQFISMVLGFIIALLLNKNFKGKGIFRTIWYLPYIVSFAIVSQMFLVMINPMDGTFNNILVYLGIEPIVWQQSPFWMIFWLVVFSVWKGVGFTAVLFLAGLQGIDKACYEAAKIDGANKFQTVLFITIPLLRPITLFVFIMGIINTFQLFDPVFFLTEGGPRGSTNVIVYQIYKDAFVDFKFGVASANSVIVLIVVLILTLITMRKKD